MFLKNESLLQTSQTKVVPLGDHTTLDKNKTIQFFRNPEQENDTGVWGTLGWKDDREMKVGYHMDFSAVGQDSGSNGATRAEIDKLYELYPEIDTGHPIMERYINLDELQYDYPRQLSLENLNELRLDIHLKKEEGALVFVQYEEKGNHEDAEAYVEYIAPCSTEGLRFDTRNKLTFEIPYLTEKLIYECPKSAELKELQLNDEEAVSFFNEDNISFVIKMLTFIRKAKTPRDALQAIAKTIKEPLLENLTDRLGDKKYALRIFDESVHHDNWEKALVQIEDPTAEIDFDKRTLLLIHGTFKDSKGSFKEFLELEYQNSGRSFLQHLKDEGIFEQIIAFDHPYFWDTVDENRTRLLQYLGSNRFAEGKLHVMAASRGGLLAYHLASSDSDKKLNIAKIMTFSSGASGYMRKVKGLAKLSSILKMKSKEPISKLAAAIASVGFNYVYKSSGLQILLPGNDNLQTILRKELPYPMEIKIMAADWHRSLVDEGSRFQRVLNRAWRSTFDFGIKVFLGKKHDWVIGTEEQVRYEGVNEDPGIQVYRYNCMHGKYFIPDFPQTSDRQDLDVHAEILAFFHKNEPLLA